jgi:hypothetical protein
MPRPNSVKGVRSLLGLANYYRRFQFRCSQITHPLRQLLKQDTPFEWSQACEESFLKLKEALTTAPVLILPNFNRDFILTTDGSYQGISYILSQKDDQGREHPVSFGGRALHPNEKNWSVTDVEALALIEGCKEYGTYLRGRHFLVLTDHVSLTFLNDMKVGGNKRWTRWSIFLQDFKFTIKYQKGRNNTAADAISRMDFDNLPKAATELSEPLDLNKRGDYLFFDYTPEQSEGAVGAIIALPSREQLAEQYASCPDFADIHAYLSRRVLPEDDERARRVLLVQDQYVLEDDLLYFMSTHKTGRGSEALPAKRICVPTRYRPHMAICLHDQSGHIGLSRLYESARHRYFFPGQYSFLKQHVLTCKTCQHLQGPGPAKDAPIQSLEVVPP